jgi:hypothetical protein
MHFLFFFVILFFDYQHQTALNKVEMYYLFQKIFILIFTNFDFRNKVTYPFLFIPDKL